MLIRLFTATTSDQGVSRITFNEALPILPKPLAILFMINRFYKKTTKSFYKSLNILHSERAPAPHRFPGGHHAEIIERILRLFQKLIAFFIPLILV